MKPLTTIHITKELTRSEITKLALVQLRLMKHRVRQVHNVPFTRKRHHVEKGWADIQGYTIHGEGVYCEVKTKRDKLSNEQIERLDDAKMCGCKCYIAGVDRNGGFELKEY